jgi:hypothetical protein
MPSGGGALLRLLVLKSRNPILKLFDSDSANACVLLFKKKNLCLANMLRQISIIDGSGDKTPQKRNTVS